MFCFMASRIGSSASFEYDDGSIAYDFPYLSDPTEFEGKEIPAFESLHDIDGTETPQFDVIKELQSLVTSEKYSDSVREYLKSQGDNVAECTIRTQFGVYTAFRSFSLYESNPNASMFRLLLSPSQPEMWREQFYSPSFVTWAIDNLPIENLYFHKTQQDERFYDLPG